MTGVQTCALPIFLNAADRLLGTRLGVAGARAIAEGKFGVMVGDRGQGTELVPLKQVAEKVKYVPRDHEWIRMVPIRIAIFLILLRLAQVRFVRGDQINAAAPQVVLIIASDFSTVIQFLRRASE